jgi:micrococcal nuclease
MTFHTYKYRAELVRAVEGETIYLNVDLGFRVRKLIRVRVLNLDTPEMNTVEGGVAKLTASTLLKTEGDFPLRVTTLKDKTDKYGRWLAVITMPDGSDYAETMTALGHVKPEAGA